MSTKVTRKAQVTIPKRVRDRLNIKRQLRRIRACRRRPGGTRQGWREASPWPERLCSNPRCGNDSHDNGGDHGAHARRWL